MVTPATLFFCCCMTVPLSCARRRRGKHHSKSCETRRCGSNAYRGGWRRSNVAARRCNNSRQTKISWATRRQSDKLCGDRRAASLEGLLFKRYRVWRSSGVARKWALCWKIWAAELGAGDTTHSLHTPQIISARATGKEVLTGSALNIEKPWRTSISAEENIFSAGVK